MKIEQEVAMVRKRESLADGICKLTLQCPKIASHCLPGQFVRLPALAQKSILPRPLAVYRVDDQGRLEVVVKDVGLNTNLYAQLRPSAKIKISGPHGKPVAVKPESENQRVWLVGGGSGLASLLSLVNLHQGQRINVIAGFKTEAEIFGQNDFEGLSAGFSLAVEEAGKMMYVFRGRASDLFASQTEGPWNENNAIVYVCGPALMEKAVAEICRAKHIPCFVFLERLMACGQGACLGCSVPLVDKTVKYVCKDGPVFPAEEVDWNELLKRG